MTGLRVIRAGEASGDTAQTSGMVRSEAISGRQVDGTAVMMPATRSDDHHHGASETGIYVVSGHRAFVFRDLATSALARLETSPGDFVWVPRTSRTGRRTRTRAPRRWW